MIGELDAGNPHVQFDEGAQETCDSATRLCPTLPQPLATISRFVSLERFVEVAQDVEGFLLLSMVGIQAFAIVEILNIRQHAAR